MDFLQKINCETISVCCRKCNTLLLTIMQDNEAEWMQETYKCKKCIRVVRLKKAQRKDILHNLPEKAYYI